MTDKTDLAPLFCRAALPLKGGASWKNGKDCTIRPIRSRHIM